MSFTVDYIELDSTMAANNAVELTGGIPVSTVNVAVDTISGTAQALNGDFGVVDATVITWDNTSYGLYGQLTTGDKLRVIYDRS